MNSYYRFFVIMHAFVGIGALFGGLAGMLDPHEPLGIPAAHLDGTPFSSYFIPSLILFIVIGLGHILSAITAYKRSPYQAYISSVFSWALMIWIVVQCIIMGLIDFLHVLYFMIGLTGAITAMRMLFRQGLFPSGVFALHGGENRMRGDENNDRSDG